MLGFIIQRFLQASVVMAVMSVIVFVGVYAIGNPIEIIIPPDATQDIREQVIRQFGLDLPLWEQYFIFVINLVQGDFGRSFIYNLPVLELIAGRLPATLELVLISIVSATLLGVTLGLYAGYRVPPFYDSLVAKVIVDGSSRNECLMRLRRALEEMVIDGISTTLPLHRLLIGEPDFLNGDYDIHWLESWLATHA